MKPAPFTKSKAQARKLPIMSGGWVSLDELIKKFDVDWTAKSLSFTLHDNSIKTMRF